MHHAIEEALELGDFNTLLGELSDASGTEIRSVAQHLLRRGNELGVASDARALAGRKSPQARVLACLLLPSSYSRDEEGAIHALRVLACDGDRHVREAAGMAAGQILQQDFFPMVEELRRWIEAKARPGRMAAIAAVTAATCVSCIDWGEPLVRLIEPLLEDRDPTLRRRVGLGALSGGLLAHHRDITFEYLIKWSTSSDAQVLWNVAMSLSGASAAPIAKKALIVLRRLAVDPRRFVWRATASATWQLGRHCPELVRSELARWLEDEDRIEVARHALQHL
ncbi:hypothetical protein JW848_07850 [Candidatus Bipolaricaulota bacterium]|nr:hypothetical protein [Candidatus Bipolaricaulota bacterium]